MVTVKCQNWKASVGLCQLRADHSGNCLDTYQNRAWKPEASDSFGLDRRNALPSV